jgi:hypothetical protein
MQDAARWYAAASVLAPEAGLACLQPGVALDPAYAPAWINLHKAHRRAGADGAASTPRKLWLLSA